MSRTKRSTHESKGPLASVTALGVTGALLVLGALLWDWDFGHPPIGGPSEPGAQVAPPQPQDVPQPEAPTRVSDPMGEASTPASSTVGSSADQGVGPCAPLEEMLDQLEQVIGEQWNACQVDDRARMERVEVRIRQVFQSILGCHGDLGIRVLQQLAQVPCDNFPKEPTSQWSMLRVLLRFDLQRKWAGRRDPAGQTSVDSLTGAVLAVAGKGACEAEALGVGLLVDQPYLGSCHVDAVLQLVEVGAADAGFRGPAVQLLQTLWNNMRERGERAPRQLEAAAMLSLGDSNPVRKQAAARYLFQHGGREAQQLVLQQLRGRGDHTLAADMALGLAERLRGLQAITAVEQLADLAGPRTTDAAARIARHSPEALRHSYEQHLADNSRPGLRAHWVTGGALLPTPQGIELCELAIRDDPDPIVQRRAMLALASQGTVSQAEQAFRKVLHTAETRRDRGTLTTLVFGLQNAQDAGHAGLVQRIAAQLRNHPLLDTQAKQLLAELGAGASR